MSSQKGNTKRTRAQKHQNRSAFKNNLHDKTKTTEMINNLVVSGVCNRCKEIIDWKIKYKKYKHLSQPKTCVKCHQKVVKMAYYIMCEPCASQQNCCAKCGEQKQIVLEPPPSASEASSQHNEFQRELRGLSEKNRRKFLRLLGQGKLTLEDLASEKLNISEKEGKLEEESDDEESSLSQSDTEDSKSNSNPCTSDQIEERGHTLDESKESEKEDIAVGGESPTLK